MYNANGEIVSFSEGWKRKSIFFTLPYWETNLIRNNLNVMCKTQEIPIYGKWQNRNFDYKIVISVKNL